MRKILLAVVSALLVMTCCIPTFAATSVSASLSASKKSPVRGDKITITLSATVDSCGGGSVEVSFDKSAFECESGSFSLSNAPIADFDHKAADGVFAFDGSKKVSGKILKFVL